MAVPSFTSQFFPSADAISQSSGDATDDIYRVLVSTASPQGIILLKDRARVGLKATTADIFVISQTLGCMLIVVVPGVIRFDMRSGAWTRNGQAAPDMQDPLERAADQAEAFRDAFARAGVPTSVGAVLWLPDMTRLEGLPWPEETPAILGRPATPWNAIGSYWGKPPDDAQVRHVWRYLFPAIPWPADDVSPAEPAITVAKAGAAAQAGKPPLKPMNPDDMLLLTLRRSLASLFSNGNAMLCGIHVSLDDLVNPERLLPALLVAAALKWAPVVVSQNGQGGFTTRLVSAPDTPLGYAVAELIPATPMLLVVPIIDAVRRTERDGIYVLDSLVLSLLMWMSRHGFDVKKMDVLDLEADFPTEHGDEE